jgi:hypothetical protein
LGDERAVADFYADYVTARRKPMMVGETSALYIAGAGGASELSVKQTWWRQLFGEALSGELPGIKLVNWFDHRKIESEVKAEVDWRLTSKVELTNAFRADLAGSRWTVKPPL